jgi:hypothetical protein
VESIDRRKCDEDAKGEGPRRACRRFFDVQHFAEDLLR